MNLVTVTEVCSPAHCSVTNTYNDGGSTTATFATGTRSSWNLWTGSAGTSVTQSGSMSVSGNATANCTLGSNGVWVTTSGTATGSGTGTIAAAYSTSATQTDDTLTFGSGWSSYNDTSSSQTGSGSQFWNQNYDYTANYASASGGTSGSWVTTAGSATTDSSGWGTSGYSNKMSSGSSYSSVTSGSDYYNSLNSKQSASGSASGSSNWTYNLQTVSVLDSSGTTTTTTTADSGAATWDASYSASSSGSSVLKTWGSNSSDTVDSWLSSSASESNGGSSSWNEGYTTVTPPSGSAYTTGSGSGTATAWGSDSYKSSASGWTKDQTWGAEEYGGGSYQNTSIGTGSQTTAGSDHYTYSGGWNAAVSSSGSVVVTPYGTDTAWGSASGMGVSGWTENYTTYSPGLGGGPPSSFTTVSSGGGHPTDWSSSYSDTKGSPQFGGGPFSGVASPMSSSTPPLNTTIPGDVLNVVPPGPFNGTQSPQDAMQITPTTVLVNMNNPQPLSPPLAPPPYKVTGPTDGATIKGYLKGHTVSSKLSIGPLSPNKSASKDYDGFLNNAQNQGNMDVKLEMRVYRRKDANKPIFKAVTFEPSPMDKGSERTWAPYGNGGHWLYNGSIKLNTKDEQKIQVGSNTFNDYICFSECLGVGSQVKAEQRFAVPSSEAAKIFQNTELFEEIDPSDIQPGDVIAYYVTEDSGTTLKKGDLLHAAPVNKPMK